MFGPEYIPAAYLEERLAVEKAKREAEEKQQLEQQTAAAPRTQSTQLRPSTLASQAFSQRPAMSRPGSSTVLGNIYQSLKTATGVATPTSTQASRGPTPCPERTAEEQRAHDEKWRELDMMNMPKWH